MANTIKGVSKPDCVLCKNPGAPLYSDLKDQLFSASGEWSISICKNCQLLWLNPFPLPEELGKMYSTYYTHADIKRKFFSALTDPLKSHVYRTLGYENTFGVKFPMIGAYIPFFKEYTRMEVLNVPSTWGKKLLDVGSGNGEYLSRMKNLGWTVEGTEFDEKAARFAKERYGVKIHVGDLINIGLPENAYDVITLNHVIEHVYDPEQMLKECKRILVPGGRIVVLTPNAQSLGHRIFKQNWRGLEIPRHMFIFSVDNFSLLAKQVGFEPEILTSTARISRYLYSTSVHMKQGKVNIRSGGNRGYFLALKSYLFQAREELYKVFNKNAGEEIYFVGKK